ncbi:hypothetical protein [Salinirubellus litoreus]|uniref:hypothetical protein n=1 Tax=unclassified Salinirubellus TaxID=2627207 RepID=UPI003606C185
MDRPPGTLGRRLWRAVEAERFVRLVVAAGLALVAGLWVAALSTAWTPPWSLGVVLALLGVGGLAAGIRSELDYP